MELSDVAKLTEDFLKLKKEIDKIEDEQIKPLNKQMLEIQSRLIKLFEANNLNKFAAPSGSVNLVVDKRVDMPKGDDKIRFVEYMKENGEWDIFATIHHSTLNSWFREKVESDPLFIAPGLGLPKETKYLKRGKS